MTAGAEDPPPVRRGEGGLRARVRSKNAIGDGKLNEFTEPGKPEAGKDMRYNPGSGPYAVMPHPTDGSIWYTVGVFAGSIYVGIMLFALTNAEGQQLFRIYRIFPLLNSLVGFAIFWYAAVRNLT